MVRESLGIPWTWWLLRFLASLLTTRALTMGRWRTTWTSIMMVRTKPCTLSGLKFLISSSQTRRVTARPPCHRLQPTAAVQPGSPQLAIAEVHLLAEAQEVQVWLRAPAAVVVDA